MHDTRYVLDCYLFHRSIWDLIMFLILSADVTLLPVVVAIYDDSLDPGWLTMDIISDIFFIIVLNFWTGLIASDNLSSLNCLG